MKFFKRLITDKVDVILGIVKTISIQQMKYVAAVDICPYCKSQDGKILNPEWVKFAQDLNGLFELEDRPTWRREQDLRTFDDIVPEWCVLNINRVSRIPITVDCEHCHGTGKNLAAQVFGDIQQMLLDQQKAFNS